MTLSIKAAFVGSGVGLVLFTIFGLLPGSLIGGAAGIKFAGILFGLPLEPGLISKSIVLISMIIGVAVSGMAIVTATTATGWIAGSLMESATRIPMMATEKARNRRK